MFTPQSPCAECSLSRRYGHIRCFWCGKAIHQGRTPSPREAYETSETARLDHLNSLADTRRDGRDVDTRVWEALRDHIQPQSDFTHDRLVPLTGLNSCALKFSLQRLASKGLISLSGHARIRSNRTRPIWRVRDDPSETRQQPAAPE